MKFLVIAFFITGTTVSSLAVAGELPTPKEIEEHLREWHADFAVMRIGYEQTWPGAPDVRCYREFTVTDTKDYYDFEEWHEPNKAPRRKVNGGNAQGRFRASYNLIVGTDEWELNGVTRRPRANDNVGSSMIVHPLWPIMLPFGHWLNEGSLADHLSVEAFEQIEGEDCIRVKYKHPAFQGGTDFIAWLSPSKQYLVKKASPPQGNDRSRTHYLCDEFKNNGGQWYPFQGRLGSEGPNNYSMNWKVTKFEVNPKLSASLFSAPDDSQIRKKRQSEAKHGKEQKQTNQAGEQLPEAIPHTWGSTLWGVALLSVAVLLVIGYFRFMKSNRF